MFMEKIETPALVAAKSKPTSLKLAVGLLFTLFSAIVMVPWLVVTGLWLIIGGAAKLVAKIAVAIYESLLYAGEAVVGR